jgi:hypothetical protein
VKPAVGHYRVSRLGVTFSTIGPVSTDPGTKGGTYHGKSGRCGSSAQCLRGFSKGDMASLDELALYLGVSVTGSTRSHPPESSIHAQVPKTSVFRGVPNFLIR